MFYYHNMRLLLFVFLIHRFTVTIASHQCGAGNEESTAEIHIIGFFPCTDPNDTRGIPVDNCDGIERIPIMKLALEEINERCDLLPGYRLVVDYANSACSSIPTLHHLIKLTDPSQPAKLMILGPACSESNFIMGEVAERFLNITQVSYRSISSSFATDKISYPRFFRVIPRSQQYADIIVAIVNKLNWRRVAMITYASDFLFGIAQDTEQKLQENKVNILTNQNFANNDPDIAIEEIKEVNARIIIAWLPITPVSVIIQFWCKVVKSQLTGPKFVWLLPGWYRNNWWNVSGINCTAEEMRDGLEHSLASAANAMITSNLSRVIVSGKNVSQFRNDYIKIRRVSGNVQTDTVLGPGYVYDAVWTIALALNSSISILEERGLGRLEDFTYDSVEMADVFTEAVLNVSFEGISESISFQKNGDRVGYAVRLQQYRGGKRIAVLIQDSVKGFDYLPDQHLIWQDGDVPRDAPVPVVVMSTLAECIIAGVVSSVGILSTIFFFVFNLCYSKHPVVKRSSYRLNSLILVGVFVGFIGTLSHVVHIDSDMSETFSTTVCNARVWTNELAFVVAFGALFAKIWRLYKVFFNKKMVQRKYLHDRHLFMMVAVIVAPILVLLIVQVVTFPLTLHTVMNVNEDDLSTEEIYSECKGTHEFIFLAFAYAEDGILALVSVLVAYQAQRHSPKQEKYRKYHESAVINLTTIFAVLLSSVCQAILIIFQLNNNQEGILLIITLRDCLWMYPMIYLLFVPKVYGVYSGVLSSRKFQQFSTINALVFTGVRSSLSSSSGRPAFVNGDLSSAERRPSDVSLGSTEKLSSGRDKREVTFSAIHEQNEEISDTEEKECTTAAMTICSVDLNMMKGVSSKEFKPITTCLKITEV